jgi:hypothetical protein
VLSFAVGTVDAYSVALLGRRRDWVRYQGRANAALVLLARTMQGEFVAPSTETEFAEVRGRVQGCTFELKIDEATDEHEPVLMLAVRHFHTQASVRLVGTGCTIPGLDPDRMRVAIEDACHRFATTN